jgi:hypothetical protein
VLPAVLPVSNISHALTVCGERGGKMKRCACLLVWYRSAGYQRDGWELHRKVCTQLGGDNPYLKK